MPGRSEKFDAVVGASGAPVRQRAPARPEFEMMVAGRRVRLGVRTLICGVLNVTPDSFSDRGRYVETDRAIEHALEMARAGADWIDVGGESTRPGSQPVSVQEELRRVLPVIRGIRKRMPRLPLSIDTTKGEVAEQALRAGASIVNDVSGLRFDASVAEAVRRHHTPLVLMHLRGRPATMQQAPFVQAIFTSLRRGLSGSIRRAITLGVKRSQLIIDPGLGFGKTRRQNFEIMARLAILRRFRLPIMVGTSRKSFIQAVVAGKGLDPGRVSRRTGSAYWKVGTSKQGAQPETAEYPEAGNSALHASAALDFGDAAAVTATILAGAHIVRVHNVAAALPAVRIADAILAASKNVG